MSGRGSCVTSLLFIAGLGVLLAAVLARLPFGQSPMQLGQEIVARAPGELGAANIVTAIVLGYRGFDTLGEVTILFVASLAVGVILAGGGRRSRTTGASDDEAGGAAGFILARASHLLFPLLLVLGAYIMIHGHLTPGGGFQGGAILAGAFFLPILSAPKSPFHHATASLVEGMAGAAFVVIGLISLLDGEAFLTPLLGRGTLGELLSAGSLPLLYLAIGLKVGSELAGLLHRFLPAGGEA
jgi:multicomponent Na+:H+ antiporter subunit B